MKKVMMLAVFSLALALSAAEKSKSIVLYFSWSDAENTRILAEEIARNTHAVVERIIPETPYPRKYAEILKMGRSEIKQKASRPIKALKNDLKKFDTVFVGSPIWFGTYAPPVRSFLQKNDLSGKKVYFFCTHGKGGPGVFFKEAALLAPRSVIGKGFNCYGIHVKKIAPKVTEWLKKDVK